MATEELPATGLQIHPMEQFIVRPLFGDGIKPRQLDTGTLTAVDLRARAYFHANCSMCHRPDAPGGRAKIDFRRGTPLAGVGVCDADPRAGDLDITDARLVAPGEPARSIVSARMHSLGSTRMPGIGSGVVDEQGLAVIDEWISGLDVCE